MDNIIAIIRDKYLSCDKEDVLKHVEDVADIAVRFAKVYNLDVAKLKLAALCHDIGGVMTPQEMYDFAIAKGLNIDPAEEKYHALLHQRISRIMVQEEYGITDPDVLNAVECHTTLRKMRVYMIRSYLLQTKYLGLKKVCLHTMIY